MNTEFMLIKQLTMKIEGEVVFDKLDFTIAQSEAVAIIGANGSGKSTLLKILVGLIQPTSGTVHMAAIDRRSIGFAPDTPPLYQNDTVNSYLNFIAGLKRVPKQQLKTRIDNCLDIFELGAVRDFYIYSLSKGTQQRVNLAQAVISNPQILILDEPTNALDSKQCENFSQYLMLLKRQQTTLIIASHQYTELMPICDYMLRLNNKTAQKIMPPLTNKDITQTNDQIHYST